VRDFLSSIWPADKAVENAGDMRALAELWPAMARQGLSSLGSDTAEVGLRETIVVFEELGRAACPAPLLGAVAANIALSGQTSNAARALLEDIHRGNVAVAVALGAFDGDAAAGRAEMRGDALSGQVSFVEGTQAATHLLVLVDTGVAVAAIGAPGVTIRATPGLAVPAFAEITFDNTLALRFELTHGALADIAMTARLACTGRALGAAQRAFDMAVEHAKVRKQFGQFIGQFQAVQHKLANGLTSLDGARLAIEAAADAYDNGNPDWRVFVSSAVAFAGPALRTVSIETHRALGAIGYAEEHEAPRHFRRVHADLVRFGGAPRARAELADFLLGPVQ
jgi:alkylation response protein AidB-like acyl-CoA dehydrogenase